MCLDVKPLLVLMTGSFFKSDDRYCLLCPGLLFVTREEAYYLFQRARHSHVAIDGRWVRLFVEALLGLVTR